MEKVSKINKNLGNLAGDDEENFLSEEDEDQKDLVDIMKNTGRAFNLGDESISNNYLSPGEVLRDYTSDE